MLLILSLLKLYFHIEYQPSCWIRIRFFFFWSSNPYWTLIRKNWEKKTNDSLPESLHLGGGGLDARLHPVRRAALGQQLSSTFLHQVGAGVSARGHYCQEMPVHK